MGKATSKVIGLYGDKDYSIEYRLSGSDSLDVEIISSTGLVSELSESMQKCFIYCSIKESLINNEQKSKLQETLDECINKNLPKSKKRSKRRGILKLN